MLGSISLISNILCLCLILLSGEVSAICDSTGKTTGSLHLEPFWTLPHVSLFLNDYNLYPVLTLNYNFEHNKFQVEIFGKYFFKTESDFEHPLSL